MLNMGHTYHAKNAIMNPNHANVNTLPYLLNGFRIGIERAFPLTGFISGGCQRVATLNPMVGGQGCESSILFEVFDYKIGVSKRQLRRNCGSEKILKSRAKSSL